MGKSGGRCWKGDACSNCKPWGGIAGSYCESARTSSDGSDQLKPAPFDLANATRWHSSCYKSVAFVHSNYDLLRFCSQETANSSEKFTAAMQSATLRTEFARYLETFAPVANFLNIISDDSRTTMPICKLLAKEKALSDGTMQAHFAWVPEPAKEGWPYRQPLIQPRPYR